MSNNLLIEGLCYAFEVKSIPPDICKFLHDMLNKYGKEKFTKIMLYWFGCRSYNEFLDYSLLAIKIANHFRENDYSAFDVIDFDETVIDGVIDKLLFDDRHDMYQNIPNSIFEEFFPVSTKEEKEKFLDFISKALIESFNQDGGDDSVNINHFTYSKIYPCSC